MALHKDEITIPRELWDSMKNAQYIIRQEKSVDSRYKDVTCPHCTLTGWWYHPEYEGGGTNKNTIKCVACNHELTVCDCGTVVTEEEAEKSGDPTMCKPCRVKFCKENDMCPECEKDLIPGENNGMKFLYCPNHCIDEVKMREAI